MMGTLNTPARPLRTSSEASDRRPASVAILASRAVAAGGDLGAALLTWDEVMRGAYARLADFEGVLCGPVSYRSAPGKFRHPRVCAALRESLNAGAVLVFMLPRLDPLQRSQAIFGDVTDFLVVGLPIQAKGSVRETRACPSPIRAWVKRHPAVDRLAPRASELWESPPAIGDHWLEHGRVTQAPIIAPVFVGEGAWVALPLSTPRPSDRDLRDALSILKILKRMCRKRSRLADDRRILASGDSQPGASTLATPPQPAPIDATRGEDLREPQDPLALDLTDDGKALRLRGEDLAYIRRDGKRRLTLTSPEGRLLLSLVVPGGVPARVRPEAVSHLRGALDRVSGEPVVLQGRADGLRLSVGLKLASRLKGRLRQPG